MEQKLDIGSITPLIGPARFRRHHAIESVQDLSALAGVLEQRVA